MPGQRGTEARRLESAITVRMDANLAALCYEVAVSENLSVASWMRGLAAQCVSVEPGRASRSKPRARIKPKAGKVTEILLDTLDHLDVLSANFRALSEEQANPVKIPMIEVEALWDRTRKATREIVAAIEAVRGM